MSASSRSITNNPMEISIAEASSLFPGFRFSPTDEELILYYLKKKLQSPDDDGVEVIAEVDICRHEPWDLPAQSVIQSENEWFFFSPRGRKYPNGSQSKRATESGYWKATGKERGVKSGSSIIGMKRTLVFHIGRAPKGQRTGWIMHEYSTSEKSEDTMVLCRLRKNDDFHLNENPTRDRNLLAIEDGTPPLSGVEQSGLLEQTAQTGHSCSKEVSSSNNSHSVEQVDPSSESDDKATNGYSQYSHPDLTKGQIEDVDCYADIMKDDIIKLDESSLIEDPRSLRTSSIRPRSETVHPFQGTANRRLRLRKRRMGTYHKEQFKMLKVETKDIPIKNSLDSYIQQTIEITFALLFVVIISTLSILFLVRDYMI